MTLEYQELILEQQKLERRKEGKLELILITTLFIAFFKVTMNVQFKISTSFCKNLSFYFKVQLAKRTFEF